MDAVTTVIDNGLVNPSHPPIYDGAELTATSKDLKAGTILKLTANTNTYEPAGTSDTPACILAANTDKHPDKTAAVIVIRHGLVIRSRLINHSGSEAISAADALINKLPAVGIYPTQGVWTDSIYQ